jgi:hypothetical protein
VLSGNSIQAKSEKYHKKMLEKKFGFPYNHRDSKQFLAEDF